MASHPHPSIMREKFSLRGEMIHAFISYCASTEGPAGNGFGDLVAVRIRALSLESSEDDGNLRIPKHAWGIWPKFAKRPEPFRMDEAKVFLDHKCRMDGQSWVDSVVMGLQASMVFVPLLSWTEGDGGSSVGSALTPSIAWTSCSWN